MTLDFHGRTIMRHFPLRFYTILLLTFLQSQFAYGSNTTPVQPADGETPASLACVYGLTSPVPGCPISSTSAVPHTGSGIIAVIEGGDDSAAYQELTQFSQQTGLRVLPQCGSGVTGPCFQTYYASNCSTTATPPSPVKIVEPEIDIEWAHAMAPNASIYMIEADGWCTASIIQAVHVCEFSIGQYWRNHFNERFFPGICRRNRL